MTDIVATFRSYALDKDNCPRMMTEAIPVRVALLTEAADEIERLRDCAEYNFMAGYDSAKADYRDMLQGREAEIERLRAGLLDAGASLAAAISLLERGGKKAAASDKMFAIMLDDYRKSLDRARAALEVE